MYSIIIVEDEDFIRNGIASLVNFKKFDIDKIFQAENGISAWDIIKKNNIDIILTDINMPKMDGITLAKKVKDQFPRKNIIFLTGYDHFDYALSAIKLGIDDYILKPVSKKDIEEIIGKTILKLKEREKINIINKTYDKLEKNKTNIAKIINNNISDSSFSLSKLANILGFSTAHAGTIVKKELHSNFQDYLTKIRMEKAKILLLSSNMKIYEVAKQVGFEDVNYFSTKFKNYVGKTPKNYSKGDI